MKGNLLIIFLLGVFTSYGQITKSISEDVTREEVEMHIRFLASDELLGRETGTAEINIAAAYIAAYYKTMGVKPLPGMDSYYQIVPFYEIASPKEGTITIGGKTFNISEDFATTFTGRAEVSSPAVFVGHGTPDEISSQDVKDKIVLIMAGEQNGTFQQALSGEYLKSQMDRIKNAGAKAAIVLWHFEAMPWNRLQGWLQKETLTQEKPVDDDFPYFFMDATEEVARKELTSIKAETVAIKYSGRSVKVLNSYNVVGYLEGSDATAKDQFVLLSAHYDHVGGQFTDNGEDKIFNGARDNAVGTAAIMMAADYFAENRPAHSVIFAAWTAEEKGLLGSKYFVDNTPVSLDKIIFNLNIDNAGYNDTTKVTVIGLDRTMAQEAIASSSAAFGLEAITDPAPEQNLFDRSDNVNFARHGIPSPTFSLGFTAFDEEIFKYYHNVADEAEGINYHYVTNYTRAFVLAAQKIANRETETFWKTGDKYEEAGRTLYKK